jgi:uncharacterized membrane protein YcaP (DUF421 family)
METVLRVAFVYFFVWACLRVLGKRALSDMSPFEFVTIMMFPQVFSRALTRQDYSLTNGIIGAATLFALVFITAVLSYRSRRVARVMEAGPTVLVQDGALVTAHLDLERISPEEIFATMHRVGLERLAQVKWAILESDGKISVVPAASEALRRAD